MLYIYYNYNLGAIIYVICFESNFYAQLEYFLYVQTKKVMIDNLLRHDNLWFNDNIKFSNELFSCMFMLLYISLKLKSYFENFY